MGDQTARVGRRTVLAGAGAAAAVALTGRAGAIPNGDGGGGKQPPAPKPRRGRGAKGIPLLAAPNPIPGTVPSGSDLVGDIHWALPGPEGAASQILGLEPFPGLLDVEPATITDFEGDSAFAIVAGTVKGSDGVTYDCEFDIRAFKGQYVGADGKRHRGAFAFL